MECINSKSKWLYKFSIVIAVYNIEPFIAEAIESILNQDIGFEENVQLILIDDGATDNSGNICDEYKRKFPNNILVIHKKNGGVSSARNEGLKFIEGEYVNFLDGDDRLAYNALSTIYKYFTIWPDVDLITIPVIFFEGKNGPHILNYKFNKGSRIIEVLNEYNYPLLFINASFVTNSVAKNIQFDERLTTAEDAKVVMQILLNKFCYGVVTETSYLYRRRTSGAASAIQNSVHSKSWYTSYVKYFATWCIDESKLRLGYIPRFVQFTLMYDLQWRYRIPSLPHDILTNDELDHYTANLDRLVKHIDDDIILAQKGIYIEHKFSILKQKYGHSPTTILRHSDILYYYNDTLVYRLSESITKIEFLKIEGDYLIIEGQSVCFELEAADDMEWYLKINNNLVPCCIQKRDVITSMDKKVALSIGFKTSYKMNKPQPYEIIFICKYKEVYVEKKKLIFGKFSPLQGAMWNSYYNAGNYIIFFEYHKLMIKPYSVGLHIHKELSYLKALLLKNTTASKKAFIARSLCHIWTLFPHKEVWLISDRIHKADDNGEEFFRFMKNQRLHDIKCYFAISKDCEDYERIKSIGKIIPYGGWLYKWLYLCGAKIISSQGEDYVFRPLENSSVYYSDLIQNSKFVFLQHGVTQNDLSGWLNKYNKNISLFITSTYPEYNSIIKKYFYSSEIVKLTGFPRYDRLYHNEQKYITVMPSWRSYLVSDISSSTSTRTPVANFTNSLFYKMYSRLLNNPRLIAKAKELGYSLQLMIHPNMASTLPFFSFDSFIKVLPASESYRKIFAESKLLVTDYSSVAFDFAYLRKPVLYYQEDKAEIFSGAHTFKEGYFDYEEGGFGEVEYDTESIVTRIIEYLENGCNIKEKYLERINKTFAFSDKCNSKRVYDEIKKI